MSDYPKFQYSVFKKNGKEEQFVIRAETFEELVEAKRSIDTIMNKVDSPMEAEAGTSKTMIPNGGTQCWSCGQPAEQKQGVSKAGKPYNGIFCSTNNKTHTKWL